MATIEKENSRGAKFNHHSLQTEACPFNCRLSVDYIKNTDHPPGVSGVAGLGDTNFGQRRAGVGIETRAMRYWTAQRFHKWVKFRQHIPSLFTFARKYACLLLLQNYCTHAHVDRVTRHRREHSCAFVFHRQIILISKIKFLLYCGPIIHF